MEYQSKALGLQWETEMAADIPVRETEEQTALRQVQAGNKNAFRFLVEHYKGAAYSVAMGFAGNPQDALDISQDAFIRAYRNLKSFDLEKPFYPWFYQILKHLCLDFIKKKKRRKMAPEMDTPLYYEDENNPELKKDIWEAISALSFEHREIIILRYFREYSYKEIAEITCKPIGTVMSSLYYSKKRMKSALGREKMIAERGANET